MAKQLKEILSGYLKGKEFKEINEIISIEEAWAKTVGQPICSNTKIISFKNQIIKIKTTTPVWRNELTMQKEIILKKLKKEINHIKLKEIKLI